MKFPCQVVSYRNSTSNHNAAGASGDGYPLYLIEILHQTTTPAVVTNNLQSCILSKFYIKPQLDVDERSADRGCILSKFYIKPQQIGPSLDPQIVVSYRNSTSNHNCTGCHSTPESVVSYRNSTSNHNYHAGRSNLWGLYLIEILHQTTTPSTTSTKEDGLYLIEILHQTTTSAGQVSTNRCCILSKFYIKPQRLWRHSPVSRSCILSKFYIKPQPWLCVVWTQKVVSYRNSTSNHNMIGGLSVTPRLYLIEILHQTTTGRR